MSKKRHFSWLALLAMLLLFVTACTAAPQTAVPPTLAGPGEVVVPTNAPTDAPTAVQPTDTAAPAETSTSPPSPTATTEQQPSPTSQTLPTEAPAITEPVTVDRPPTVEIPVAPGADLAINASDLILHPVPEIYAGDRVTFQLLPVVPDSVVVFDVWASILIDGQPLTSGPLERRNWDGQAEGVFEWAWDTTGQTGEHEIRVIIDPNDTIQAGDENPANNEIAVTVNVIDGRLLSQREAEAEWITAETGCCIIYVVSETAAARDIDVLAEAVEAAARIAGGRLTEAPREKYQVYFIDRILGQGGFAGGELVVSYVDRRYAGEGLHVLLVHELVHILDQQIAPHRSAMLAEGLAVWASGGHYKPENLTDRSVALLSLDRYVPLAQLADDFYPVQHEVGYLEAGGFVTYLVDRFGWPAFRDFYATPPADGQSPSQAIDSALQKVYGLGLAQLEADWLAFLGQQPVVEAEVNDLAATIRYYNVMRRYQQTFDPTAYFLTAWLPPATDAREHGHTADLSRRPKSEVNIALELMLRAAATAMELDRFDETAVLLDSVSRVLDSNGSFVDPLSTSYRNIVRSADEFGYELHSVDLQGSTALATATQAPRNQLTNLNMEQRGQNWVILSH